MSATTPEAARTDHLEAALVGLADLLAANGRSDMVQRIDAAAVRLARPATVVCVVGEFKQGKSSLVNSLLGQSVCPVDDDIATATITLVRHGEQPSAIVRYRGDAEPRAERIPVADIARFVNESNVGDLTRGVERVDVAVPSTLLADGLAVVDTPGMGGMGAGHAAATLAFLPFADGLLFVTDATSELTATEVGFLERAHSLCPYVLVVVTKTDIAPAWRRIVSRNAEHLAARGLHLPIVAVSSALRDEAFASRDRALNNRSGFPELIALLSAEVIDPARDGAAERARTEGLATIESLSASLSAERRALADPAERSRLADQAAAMSAKLEALQAGSARWNIVLGDRITDLTNDINHRFRGSIRGTTQQLDEQIEQITSAEQWDELSRGLQTAVADAVTNAFVAVERGRTQIRDEVAELLSADDVVGPGRAAAGASIDTTTFWRTKPLADGTAAGKALKTGLTGLRGAQSGIMLLGVSGQFLPTAAAVFIASNPVLLGVGAVFGGMQLIEDRKRKIQARRQQARSQMRQFTDDVTFEMGNELGKALRQVQRDLRDEFIELITELRTTWTAAAKQAEAALHQGSAGVERRTAAIDQQLDQLRRLRDDMAIGAPARAGSSGEVSA